LLEKASTYALFDKGAVAVSCRRTNRLVRDYIGATGKGPLVGLEKRMLSRGKGGVVDFVDPDMLDDYYSGEFILVDCSLVFLLLAYYVGRK